ncbi:MAG: BatA domain-containing protein [Bacteroidia bacterium]|nr:BatA domain-containing protein [Bacteroidia bacterium]
MNFLFPGFLWALLLLAIPVIVHLFNFRRYKKIFFTNVRFLKSVTEETKSGNKLKKLLILATRLLALTFLILAFAQPYFPKKDVKKEKGAKAVSIYLDNSFSMNSEGAEGQVFEAAKNRARAIVSSYGNTDKFQLITNDLEGSMMHFSTKETCIDNIDKVKLSASVKTLSEIVSVQNKSLKDQPLDNRISFIITDFQQSISNLNPSDHDSLIAYRFVKVASIATDNLSIDSCWFVSPVLQAGLPQELMVRVKNFGNSEVKDAGIELESDGKKKGLATLSIAAFGQAETKITFTESTTGFHKATLSLTGDRLSYDDKLYLAFNLKESTKVLCVSRSLPEKFVHAVFSNAPGFVLTEQPEAAIQYSSFKNQDLIVLNGLSDFSSGLLQELKSYIENGGNIMIIPASDKPATIYETINKTLGIGGIGALQNTAVNVSFIDREHPLFGNVFRKYPQNINLPTAEKYYKINGAGGSAVMKLQNGDPFIESYQRAKGYVFISAVPLDDAFSNFRSHALFVPVMLRSSLVKTFNSNLYYASGQTEFIPVESVAERNRNYVLKNGNTELVPEIVIRNNRSEINTNGEVEVAGHYDLSERGSDKSLEVIAFNNDRRESDTRLLDDDGINSISKIMDASLFTETQEAFTKAVAHIEKGTPLWKWFIFLTLICLAIEILLIRFFKV